MAGEMPPARRAGRGLRAVPETPTRNTYAQNLFLHCQLGQLSDL